jgi:hypothetical protein
VQVVVCTALSATFMSISMLAGLLTNITFSFQNLDTPKNNKNNTIENGAIFKFQLNRRTIRRSPRAMMRAIKKTIAINPPGMLIHTKIETSNNSIKPVPMKEQTKLLFSCAFVNAPGPLTIAIHLELRGRQ